jgi:hypothetical protein
VVRLEHPAEIETILFGVGEGVGRGARLDLAPRRPRAVALDRQLAGDAQLAGRLGEGHDRDRVAQDVVDPFRPAGGREVELGRQQPEVMAVPRAEHEPMRAKADGPAVPIDRRILLAKSRKGDESGQHSASWLDDAGLESYFCPDWRRETSRSPAQVRASSRPSHFANSIASPF